MIRLYLIPIWPLTGKGNCKKPNLPFSLLQSFLSSFLLQCKIHTLDDICSKIPLKGRLGDFVIAVTAPTICKKALGYTKNLV